MYAIRSYYEKAEALVRKVGGEEIANDLIKSMNNAASKAAPKTAEIFVDAINKMTRNNFV